MRRQRRRSRRKSRSIRNLLTKFDQVQRRTCGCRRIVTRLIARPRMYSSTINVEGLTARHWKFYQQVYGGFLGDILSSNSA
uniref:Uncharacterized protein n=1 Tax=Romanomermis culicivorax TaxID=13658 RepID=A0A915JUX5_ROMCU